MIAEAEAQKNIDHAWTWIQGMDRKSTTNDNRTLNVQGCEIMSDFFEQDICRQSPFSLHSLRRTLIQSSVWFHTLLENFVLGLQVLDDAQEKEEWVLTKIRSLVTRAGKMAGQHKRHYATFGPLHWPNPLLPNRTD